VVGLSYARSSRDITPKKARPTMAKMISNFWKKVIKAVIEIVLDLLQKRINK
jgi:hypothetical protein